MMYWAPSWRHRFAGHSNPPNLCVYIYTPYTRDRIHPTVPLFNLLQDLLNGHVLWDVDCFLIWTPLWPPGDFYLVSTYAQICVAVDHFCDHSRYWHTNHLWNYVMFPLTTCIHDHFY